MNASTIIMPCNYTGYQEPSTTASWGIVDFDWSNNLRGWSGATPMDNDERQLIQVKLTKSSPDTAPYTKVWIYRNTVYGYPWFTSVRKLLDDPAYMPWFLTFNGTGPGWANNTKYHSPPCDDNYSPPKCSRYFHTQMDTPLPTTRWGPEGKPIGGYGQCFPKDENSGCDCGTKPCGFYVFNHSTKVVINGQSFRDWFLDTYMFNEVGGNSLVDGFYWDDTWYPGGVGDDPMPGMIEDMGLSQSDLLQLTADYTATMEVLINRTLAAGKFAWQLLTNFNVRAGDPASCKSDLQEHCTAGALPQTAAMHYQLSSSPGARPGNFTSCVAFGCTCKGAADFYGIGAGGGASFGCAPKAAQDWWIHEAKPCTSPSSCCAASDYTHKLPPYPGCPEQPVSALALDLANFLLIRGDYAWLGHGWQGCSQPTAAAGGGYPFPPELRSDYGTPLGVCAEKGGSGGSGVFVREFTKATVKMDCNTGEPSIAMKGG